MKRDSATPPNHPTPAGHPSLQRRGVNNSLPDKGEHLDGRWGVNNSPPDKGEYPEGGRGLNNIPELRTFRKALRNHLTPAEAKLWIHLKQSQLDGRKFRRQHSIGNYILDFYCPAERLAVELDGAVHDSVSAQEYDHERDQFLACFGIKVLRFENKWVFQQTEAVLTHIKNHFGWQALKQSSEQTQKIESLKTHKKGLMQQLFLGTEAQSQ